MVAVLAATSAGSASAALCLPILCTPGGGGGGGTGTPPPPGPAPGDEDVIGSVNALGANAAHTDYVADPTLVPPLAPRWARVVRHSASGALSGSGRIFLILDGRLRALDPVTGKDLWSVAVATTATLKAYDAGRLFVVEAPYLRALSAVNGQVLWTASTPGDAGGFGGATPVAANGMVYVSTALSHGGNSTSELLALDAATGQVRWETTADGTQSTPTLGGGRVTVGFECLLEAFDARSGGFLWRHDKCLGSGFSGGIGFPLAYYAGRLYDAEGTVYDAITGYAVASFGGGLRFADGVTVAISGQANGPSEGLTADDVASRRLLWHHSVPRGPDLTGYTRALIAGGSVYTLSDSRLAAFALHSGQHVFSEDLRLTRPGDPRDSTGLLAAAPGLLIVSGRRFVVGFMSAFQPPARGLDVSTTLTDVRAGQRVKLGGLLGSSLRAGRPRVTVEEDLAPFDGGWHAIGHPHPNSDGFFELALHPDRDVRLRARSGRRTSPAVTVYAYPSYRFGLLIAGHRLRVSFTITGPRTGLSGRRAVIYLGRVAKHRYQRLGSGVLHGGRGRFRGVTYTPIPSHTHTNDTVTLCVPGGPRLGLGRVTMLDRHCGASSVRMLK